MFDFLRNLGRSEKEKQGEALSAYLDDELAPADRDRFEQQLAQNSDLQDELAEMQLWQQQMRDLPARRVPRNFTLDPALYGRPQRQFLGGAYPVLRTATALTAFLLVIALAANVYMSSFSANTALQSTLAPVQEMAAGESAPAEIAQIEEEAAVEADIAMDAEMAAELPAEPPATPFALEPSIDKESEAAEAPVEIAGAEEAPLAETAEEEAFAEPELGEGEEILAEELREELSGALEFVEETAESPAAGAAEAASSTVDAPPEPEPSMIDEALPATAVPDLEEQRLFIQPTPAMDETAPQAPSLLPVGLEPIILGLGLLFIFLIILTMIARWRS